MKRTFTCLSLFVAAAVVLTSCSSTSSITKRRYTRGYYVSHAAKSHDTRVQEPVKTSRLEAPATVAVLPEVSEQQKIQVYDRSPNEQKPERVISASGTTRSKSIAKTDPGRVAADLSIQKPFKSVNNSVKSAKNLYTGGDDPLSLFWIVILIVLILWALGLIIDLGGLVNLLLLVALILLILWLLRVL